MTPEQFWKQVVRGEDCWLWKGWIGNDGYGVVPPSLVGTPAAHRVALILATGQQLLPSLPVCHACDNRQCVRPDHLRVGSASDNARDVGAARRRERKAVIYKLRLSSGKRWGHSVGYGGVFTHHAHITSDGSFAMCGQPLVYLFHQIRDAKHYGILQKYVCIACLNVINEYWPDDYFVVRKMPE